MNNCWHRWFNPRVLLLLALPINAWAGGSGLNVAVIVNQNSTNSVQLGNYYCERRQVPAQNLLRINWTGGNVVWTESDFNTTMRSPFLAMLASRQLTNQIDYVVLSMDIPYRVNPSVGRPNSTTSTLFYGFKSDSTPVDQCSIAAGSTNLYAGSEAIFRSTPPISAASNSFLVTMITASNLASAKQIVDSGVLADASFPTQSVYLAKSSDPARNVRFATFDNAIFNTRLRGNYSMQRTNQDINWVYGNILGLQNGVYYSGVAPTSFVPGGMADNLTSFGGDLFEETGGQLNLLQFLTTGAAGSFGTVDEPCAYLEKFPSPQNYFYQARGFSLAECYYQSLTNPYQGLVVGEPLAAPFAQTPSGFWTGLPANALLSGTTNLSLQFAASDANHPVQQVGLFLDGTWIQALTNVPPGRSNVLNVTINGNSMNYLIPLGATIKSVASGLTGVLNSSANTNATKVSASAHGDRIELESFDLTKKGDQVFLSTSNSIGTGTALTSFIAASRTNFLDTIANGIRSFLIAGNPLNGDFLQVTVTKTNGSQTSLAVTNNSSQTLAQMTQQLLAMINSDPSLTGSDGLAGEDLLSGQIGALQAVQFNLRARSAGWDAAQIQANLSGSLTFIFQPAGTVNLDENLADLQPRNHLYLTAGVTNLTVPFAFNTLTQADGFHELTAVIYEGSHVRTQKRISQTVKIQNNPLSATFNTLVGATNSAVEGVLQFSVVANTNNISNIELFSTGGSLSNVVGQSSAFFAVAGTNLGLGLHPFYAVVTATSGKQYRTETKWIRLVGADSPFPVSITAPPPKLAWPATAGRRYEILSSTNITNAFQVRDSITASNSAALWAETNASAPQRFYRVRTAN